jgi:hypothetical protein
MDEDINVNILKDKLQPQPAHQTNNVLNQISPFANVSSPIPPTGCATTSPDNEVLNLTKVNGNVFNDISKATAPHIDDTGGGQVEIAEKTTLDTPEELEIANEEAKEVVNDEPVTEQQDVPPPEPVVLAEPEDMTSCSRSSSDPGDLIIDQDTSNSAEPEPEATNFEAVKEKPPESEEPVLTDIFPPPEVKQPEEIVSKEPILTDLFSPLPEEQAAPPDKPTPVPQLPPLISFNTYENFKQSYESIMGTSLKEITDESRSEEVKENGIGSGGSFQQESLIKEMLNKSPLPMSTPWPSMSFPIMAEPSSDPASPYRSTAPPILMDISKPKHRSTHLSPKKSPSKHHSTQGYTPLPVTSKSGHQLEPPPPSLKMRISLNKPEKQRPPQQQPLPQPQQPPQQKRKVFLCSACGTYYENWNLFLHMREIHKRHICLICLGIFASAERLVQHLQVKHKIVSDHTFQNRDELLSAYYAAATSTMTTNSRNEMQLTSDIESLYLMCCRCEHVFNDSEEFTTHQCEHYFEPCQLCGLTSKHAPTCKGAVSWIFYLKIGDGNWELVGSKIETIKIV